MDFNLQGYGSVLLAGTWMTIQLALSSLVLGLALGMCGALARTSSNWWLRKAGLVFSSYVRGIPELIWVLSIYYGTGGLVAAIGHFLGYEQLELSSFVAGTIALGLCYGAYATEILRGALLAIPIGQKEAGQALGLSRFDIFFRIIMPQTWRVALPGLGNIFMVLMKDTALVSAIGLWEIMHTAHNAALVTKQPFLFFLTAGGIYLLLTLVSTGVLMLLEKHARRGLASS